MIHTPTLTATKFWPAETMWGNHMAVFARLIIDGDDFGVNAFMVQIRTLDTHLEMPGVKLGEIGPTSCYTTLDNGWMFFNNVRIPRENMFSRFAEVTKEGEFVVKGDLRTLRAGLTNTR